MTSWRRLPGQVLSKRNRIRRDVRYSASRPGICSPLPAPRTSPPRASEAQELPQEHLISRVKVK